VLPIQAWPASTPSNELPLSSFPHDGSSNYPTPPDLFSTLWSVRGVKSNRTSVSQQTYNDLSQYTLGLQGLDSKVVCKRVVQTPVMFTRQQNATDILRISGVCPLGRDILPNNTNYLSMGGIKTLGFWACGDGEPDADGSFDSYVLYLEGHGDYNPMIGNISCTMSAKPAVFPVTFSRQSDTFSISETEARIASTSYPSDPIKLWILWLGHLISEGQSLWGNSVAESVLATSVETNSSSSTEDREFIDSKLVGFMIQGIIEYQVGVSSRRLTNP
jgi:hypothetical protein